MRKTLTLSLALFTIGLAFAATQQAPDANPKQTGNAAPNKLLRGLQESPVAQGSWPLENPSSAANYYGYGNDGPMLPAPGDTQTTTHNVEATRTEPDKNTYLILTGQHGADPNYNYGTRFLFQGHENAAPNAAAVKQGIITRINLDADAQHRVTALASADNLGAPLPLIDGSTWYPFAQRLLFTSESGASGGVWQATSDYPSTVEDLSGIFGRAGYEGIQSDSRGNIILLEDNSGSKGSVNSHARQPNSFLYRFIPYSTGDLTQGGRLQVLQVMSKNHVGPIIFHAGQADADIKSQDVLDLHTYGLQFQTNWLTIHDTAVVGNQPFDANALAKAAGGTPFKRPENGQFRPGTNFTEFYFDETGDTDIDTEAGSQYGGFGSLMKLTLTNGVAGTLKLLYLGDSVHTAFDNCAFWSQDVIVFVEDAGDSLHTQRNAYDSAYAFDVRVDYSNAAAQPVRVVALGRDASATIDSALSANGNGFQNDGDNEITGWHVSDGDATANGLLGAKIPTVFQNGWRVFYTQQHGDNNTFEITPIDPANRPTLTER